MRVAIIGYHDTDARNQFQQVAPDTDLLFCQNLESVASELESIDGIIGSISGSLIEHAPKLRWVHSPAAGVNNELSPEMVRSDIILTSSAGNGGIPLAEHSILLMLMLNRSAVRWIEAQQNHVWERFEHGELNGKTVGIVGLGNAGSDLALKAKAFHMRVIGMRRNSHVDSPHVDELFEKSQFHAFLEQCDFVVVTAPYTPETHGMFDEAAFVAMKPTSYFVCISRGGIADDAALLHALKTGEIAGAGLDAHGIEPLPADSEFWSLPNVIVTPHNGATTRETALRGKAITLENLQRFCEGRSLLNIVDKNSGY